MEHTVNAFIEYLKEQVGQPYLWGGQHTRLTPENYLRIIERKEAGRGGYPDGTSYAQAAIDFCKKKFDAGARVLYAYDCSGLGCYWLCNLTHLYRCDVNANTMMGRCELRTDGPKQGWWVFRLDGKRASHIGYMIDDEYLIEAKGRRYGVVKTKFRAKDWACWGIPMVFEKELTPQPGPGATGSRMLARPPPAGTRSTRRKGGASSRTCPGTPGWYSPTIAHKQRAPRLRRGSRSAFGIYLSAAKRCRLTPSPPARTCPAAGRTGV